MNNRLSALHAGTPAVTVTGTAGPVLTLRFLRHPDEAGAATPARILDSRTVTDVPARTVRLYGARPLNGGAADATTVSGLAGQPLRLHTADGDATLTLTDSAGRPLLTRSAQGTVTTLAYEDPEAAGRPLSVTETVPADGAPASRVREAFIYGAADDTHRARNLAGTLTEHRHNAGLTRILFLSLTGQPMSTEEQLLTPEASLPDWPASDSALETPPLTMTATFDGTGTPLAQTNAAGVTTVTAYDISGAVRQTRLRWPDTRTASGMTEVLTLTDILRRADGVVLSQTAGNVVTEHYEYDPCTQRLARHTVDRPDGHPQGTLVISDLHYGYDPAGNILFLNEAATATGWHRNQVTNGERHYIYDTLSRLASASGRERVADTAPGPQTRLRSDGTGTGGDWFPYTERYTYDDGDNLTVIMHEGNAPWTRTMTVSAASNRALLTPVSGTQADPDGGFLPGGLQMQLSDGRSLSWHADGQLHRVSPVTREGAEDDTEHYRYRDGGTRVRKVSTIRVRGGTQTQVTTYAGGCEQRTRSLNGALSRDIIITESGGARLVQDRLTRETRLRYIFTDHLNSSSGETDGDGSVTSREEYYPYGGSAGADEEAEEAADRTRRFSGRERDATGLIYYGWRYYQPETGRWLSADPGGLVDGVNLFRFCRDNPVNIIDTDGRGCSSSKAVATVDARDEMEARRAEAALQPEITLEDRKKGAVRQLADVFTNNAYYEQGSEELQWLGEMNMDNFTSTALRTLMDADFSQEDAQDVLEKAIKYGGKKLNNDLEREIRQERREQQKIEAQKAAAAARADTETKRKQNSLFAIWAHDSPNIQKGGETRFNARKVINALRDKMDEGVVGRRSWSATTGSDTISDIQGLDGQSYAQIAEKLDVAINKTSRKQTNMLYRGLDQYELSLWHKAGQDGVFSQSRFTAFSGTERVAQTFGGAGIVELEAGATGGADVGLWYSGVNENEILFGRNARFQIRSISSNRVRARFQ